MNHLGGHLGITHTDSGALDWLKEKGVETLLDVGCSVGWQVELANMMGIQAWGLDGDYSLVDNPNTKWLSRIFFSDLTKCDPVFPTRFDAVWCVEVAEHIEEKYTDNLLSTLASNLEWNGLLVFTANEGPGIHHVNLKPESWWIQRLAEFSLIHDPKLTIEIRSRSTMQREFIRNTGNVFWKGSEISK